MNPAAPPRHTERLADEAATERLGERLASALRPGDVVSLTGPLGAGKTTLVRGIARGLGSPAHVRSASFAWVQEYEARIPIVHIDLYRLKHIGDLAGIGWEEYLARASVVLVEWGEKAADAMPEEIWEIALALDGNARRADLTVQGSRLGARAAEAFTQLAGPEALPEGPAAG